MPAWRVPGSESLTTSPAQLSVAAESAERLTLTATGDYVGPATSDPSAFISLDDARSKPDTVAVTYKIPGSCNACADGTYIPVSYHWNGTEVVRTGTPPHL